VFAAGTVQVTRSAFVSNRAATTGGALHLAAGASPSFAGGAAVSFTGNRAVSGGGALFFADRAACGQRPADATYRNNEIQALEWVTNHASSGTVYASARLLVCLSAEPASERIHPVRNVRWLSAFADAHAAL
jgi:predicted outer membrane repeat protein